MGKIQEVTAATQLARELDGLPLALEQAGAYIRELEVSFGDYKQAYDQQKLTLLEEQAPVMGDYPRSHHLGIEHGASRPKFSSRRFPAQP